MRACAACSPRPPLTGSVPQSPTNQRTDFSAYPPGAWLDLYGPQASPGGSNRTKAAPPFYRRIRITARGASTGGKYMEMEEVCGPRVPGTKRGRSCSPLPHLHPHQSERFTVVRGSLGYSVGDAHFGPLGPGESATVPPGAAHYFYNDNNATELAIRVRLSPALTSDVLFENLAGLARDAGRIEDVNPLHLLLLTYAHGVVPAAVPAAVSPYLKIVVQAVGALIGLRAEYPEYTTKSA